MLLAGLVGICTGIRNVGAEHGFWGRSSSSLVRLAENSSDFKNVVWVDREAQDIRLDADFTNNSPYWVKGISVECRVELEDDWIPIGESAMNAVIAPGGSYHLSKSGGDGRSVYVTGSTCQAHYAEASEKPF